MKNEVFVNNYEKYHRLVLKVAYAQTGNLELAKEICQQTFIAYFENMESISADIVKAWLLLCVRNQKVDYSRKASTRREVPFHDIGSHATWSVNDNLAEQTINRELVQTIMDDLKEMNSLWYEVVDAVCVTGMKQEEAATHLGISVVVLRNRLYRARTYIRKKYMNK